jgi:histone H2A
MAAEVIELGGNVASENGCYKISPRHITLGIRNDQELSKVGV